MKPRNIILIISLVLILAILGYNFYLDYKFRQDDIIQDPQAYSKDELVELFHQEQELFMHVAQILLSNDDFYEKNITNPNTATISGSDNSAQVYFSEAEWNEIVHLFTTIKPAAITRYGNYEIAFYFPNGENQCADLLYFPTLDTDPDQVEFGSGVYDDTVQVADGWYVGFIFY